MHQTRNLMKYLKNKIYVLTISTIVIFSLINNINIGLSWDELFHYYNGKVRFDYLISIGKNKNFNFSNNIFYPGFFDTLSYAITFLIKKINTNLLLEYFVQVRHIINFSFTLFGLVGLYKFTILFFNKETSLLTIIFILINPFFFGHSGINPKDTIIFFSFIWFIYFLCKYLIENKIKYFFLLSLFVGFGCGVRLSFIGIIIPILLIGLFYKIKFSKNFNFKTLIVEIVLFFIIVNLIIISTWPHVLEGGLRIYYDTIIKSFNWSEVPFYGVLNGDVYEIRKTPSSYFYNFFFFRMPFYSSFLIIFGFLITILYKQQLFEIYGRRLLEKIYLIFFVIFFPLSVSILMKVNLYDNIRLFLFILPFISILNAIILIFIYNNYKKNIFLKFCFIGFTILLGLFFYRFSYLTPYQYTYINYSYMNLEKANNKFEHDYWNTSFKELVDELETKYEKEQLRDMKFTSCGGDPRVLSYYLNIRYGIKKIYSPKNADFIIMTNRGLFKKGPIKTCFQKYKGENLIEISRKGMILSVLRKIN